MASRNSPEQLGSFTYGQYRDVIGRVTPPVEIEDVYSFGVNQNTLVGIVADLAPANITYTYLSPSSPGFSERSSRLGDRLVNINFTLAKDSNDNGYYDTSDQILFTVLDGQNNIPALNLASGRYFLIYADDQERFGGADLPSIYNTRVHFFTPDNSFAWSSQVAQIPVKPPATSGNSIPVYRFYNRRSGVHLYTPDAGERDSVIRNSYGEGTSYEKLRANPSSADPLTGGWGYKFEGIAYQALDNQGTALFRFYNADKGYHFLSSSKDEASNVIKNSLGSGYDLNNAVNKDPITGGWGYRYEGQTYKVSTIAQQGINQPVYRFYNVSKGVHFYTASSDERDTVIRQSIGANYVGRLDQANNAPLVNGGWGYKYEGVSWYI
jgi:hypothetical protein